MKDVTLLLCIKGQPKMGLRECMDQCEKDQLESAAREHRLEIEDKITTTELKELVINKILEDFEKDLTYFSIMELDYISRLISSQPIETDDVKYLEYHNLCALGYVFLFNYKEHVYSVVPKELQQLLPIIDNQIFKDKSAFHQKLYAYVMALLNLYGVYPVEQLVHVWNIHNKVKLSYEEAYDYVDIMAMRQGLYALDVEYIIPFNFMDDDVDYEYLLIESTKRDYFIPKKSDIEIYSDMDFYEKSDYFKKLEQYITSKDIGLENRSVDLLWELADACVMDESVNSMMETVNEYGFVFNGLEDVNTFMKLMMELSNNTRKWILRGHMPSELFEKYEKPFLKPLPKKPFVMKQDKPLRNELCPCGSNLKYKKCCGKFIN
jgi:hypothetical protein